MPVRAAPASRIQRLDLDGLEGLRTVERLGVHAAANWSVVDKAMVTKDVQSYDRHVGVANPAFWGMLVKEGRLVEDDDTDTQIIGQLADHLGRYANLTPSAILIGELTNCIPKLQPGFVLSSSIFSAEYGACQYRLPV